MNIIKGALQTVDVETAIIRGGYIPVNSFEKGFTLASPEQALQLEKTNEYFVWSGSFPKTVPKESTPDTIGGFGPNAWIDVSNLTFRTQATAPDGYTLIPSLQPRPACGRTIYADRNAGVFLLIAVNKTV